MNEKKPIIIACAVLSLIILAGGAAIYYFRFVVLPEREKVLAQAREAVKQAQEKKAKIDGLKKEILKLSEDEAKEKTRIPDLDGLEYDGLANLLDDIRKRTGVDVAKGTYSQAKSAGGAAAKGAAPAASNVHKVQYDLGVKGGFHQLLRYLNQLEKERRFLFVESFTVGKGSEGGAARGATGGATQAVRDLKVVVSSYTYRPTAPARKAPPPEDKGGVSTDVPE